MKSATSSQRNPSYILAMLHNDLQKKFDGHSFLKNHNNGRVPHLVLEINGVGKFSVAYFGRKREFRLFDQYGGFKNQNVVVFADAMKLIEYIATGLSNDDLVKYRYQKNN